MAHRRSHCTAGAMLLVAILLLAGCDSRRRAIASKPWCRAVRSPASPSRRGTWGSDRFVLTRDACAGRRLAANASCTVTVTFAPLVGGSVLARLRAATSQGGDSTAFLIG